MRYVLACLSHGFPASRFQEQTLRSFAEHVTPTPVVITAHHDGPGTILVGGPSAPKSLSATAEREGFCRATARLWHKALVAADTFDCEYVFWLEHDFRFSRPVDLNALGAVLRDERIIQVSLLRQPVNAQEKRRGRVLGPDDDTVTVEDGWLRHRRYFTTNPSLMRAAFMRDHPFGVGPSRLPYDIECEGRYGLDLIRDGYQFAVMGDGTPWVTHIGERDGRGY